MEKNLGLNIVEVDQKEVDNITIDYDHNHEEDSGVSSPQGNISHIHVTIPNTPIIQQIKDYPKIGEPQFQVVDFNEEIK